MLFVGSIPQARRLAAMSRLLRASVAGGAADGTVMAWRSAIMYATSSCASCSAIHVCSAPR